MIIYDIASLLLIGVSHIYLFNLLIGFKKMPISLFVIIGVLFTIFLTMSVTFSGLVELNLILLFSFLMLIGFMSKRAKLTHTIYFSLLSIVMYTVIKNGLYALVYQVYLDSPFNYYVWTPSILQFATLLFIWVMMYLAKGKIQLVGNYLRESKLFISTFILIMICTTLLFIVNYPSSTVLADINMRYGEQLYLIILFVSVVLMLVISISVYMSKERLIEQHDQQMHAQLMDYVNKLEFMHDELATFRHDYMNLLLSLEEAIRRNDMQQIRQIYEGTIAPTTAIVNHKQLELTKLSRVTIPELKSVLSVKILTAQQKRLNVKIDIPEPIEKIHMPMDQFIRIISILIDNAMEAAVNSNEKLIQIALFEVDEATQYCIVKNSMDTNQIDVEQMYNKRYSTKGTNRGYGLFSVKRITNQYPNITMTTAVVNNLFEQSILLKGNVPFMNEKGPNKKNSVQENVISLQ